MILVISAQAKPFLEISFFSFWVEILGVRASPEVFLPGRGCSIHLLSFTRQVYSRIYQQHQIFFLFSEELLLFSLNPISLLLLFLDLKLSLSLSFLSSFLSLKLPLSLGLFPLSLLLHFELFLLLKFKLFLSLSFSQFSGLLLPLLLLEDF